MLWGYFMKRVAADRAALFVNQVYGNWQGCGGLVLAGATALYALQVYCDFYGYSTMALGAALRESALALLTVALCMMLGCVAARMARWPRGRCAGRCKTV